MQNEGSYYLAFLYTSLVLGLTAAGIIVCVKMLEKGVRTLVVGVVFICLVSADLIAFTVTAMPYFTLPRSGITFNESKSDIKPFEKRIYKLYIKDNFRYFQPALYETATAFDSGRIFHFDKGHIRANLEKISAEIKDGVFPLQKYVISSGMEDFVRVGLQYYDEWTKKEKESYLNIVEISVEEFALKSNFYFIFPRARDLIFLLRKGTENGYATLDNGQRWTGKKTAAEAFLSLLRIRSNFLENIQKQPRVFYGEVLKVEDPLKGQEIHDYIFNMPSFDATVANFVIKLNDQYRLDSPTFVRFKEYDRMVKLYDPESFYEQLPLVRQKIRKDCAISAPIFRFYENASYVDNEKYWEMLKDGEIEKDVLYLDNSGSLPEQEMNMLSTTAKPDYDREFLYSVDKYTPNMTQVSFYTAREGYLYYSDGYDKYWRVTVNGKKRPLLRANGLFKAVKVPAGKNEVVFEYDPIFFRVSLGVYYPVSILCLGFLLLKRRKIR